MKARMEETLELLETLTTWSEEMLKLDTETLGQVLKLGIASRDVEPIAAVYPQGLAIEEGHRPDVCSGRG